MLGAWRNTNNTKGLDFRVRSAVATNNFSKASGPHAAAALAARQILQRCWHGLTFPCLLVVMVLWSLSIILSGELAMLPKHDPGVPDSVSSVLIMRHCVRSTKLGGIIAVPGMKFYNNYSKTPWPDFPVRPYDCMPRGLESLKAIGHWWNAKGKQRPPDGPINDSSLPMPLRVVADECDRDIASAKAFLEGFYGPEVPEGTLEVDAKPFTPAGDPRCSVFTVQEVAEEVAARLQTMPEQADFEALRARFWKLLGRGAAGDWRAAPCEVDPSSGALIGRCIASSAFAERFLMELGSGQDFAWGHGDPSEMPELYRLRTWQRVIERSSPKLVARKEASIFASVLSALRSATPGTMVLLGHDDQLNALSGGLGLSWSPKPFPDNSTLPASAVHLRRIGQLVEAEYLYIPDLATPKQQLSRVPVTFWKTGKASIDLPSFIDLTETAFDPHCANFWNYANLDAEMVV